MDPTVIQLLANLAEVAARNSAGAIAARVSAIKANKQSAETVNQLTEIINDLVSDRDSALSIARGLQEELVSQQISDDDINHIVETVLPVIKSIAAFGEEESDSDEGSGAEISAKIDQIRPILSQDTLKVLQTLGFNYRAAIGEPLTMLLRNLILAQAQSVITSEELMHIQAQRDIEIFRLAQDPDSYQRLQEFREG